MPPLQPLIARRAPDARGRLLATAIVVLSMTLAAAAGAEEAALTVEERAAKAPVRSNETCLSLCHAVKGMRSGPDSIPVPYVDPEALDLSIHRDARCIECHLTVTETPHDNDLEPARCDACHEEAAADHGASVHGRGEDVPGCADCHGTHEITTNENPRSKVYPLTCPGPAPAATLTRRWWPSTPSRSATPTSATSRGPTATGCSSRGCWCRRLATTATAPTTSSPTSTPTHTSPATTWPRPAASATLASCGSSAPASTASSWPRGRRRRPPASPATPPTTSPRPRPRAGVRR